MDTEKEIQARVDFKINEVLTAVENTCNRNWVLSFQTYPQKHQHYWEAFAQVKQMLIKEMKMATPFDDMAEQKRRAKRDVAINKIMNRFCKGGTQNYRDYVHRETLLLSIIEDAQNW